MRGVGRSLLCISLCYSPSSSGSSSSRRSSNAVKSDWPSASRLARWKVRAACSFSSCKGAQVLHLAVKPHLSRESLSSRSDMNAHEAGVRFLTPLEGQTLLRRQAQGLRPRRLHRLLVLLVLLLLRLHLRPLPRPHTTSSFLPPALYLFALLGQFALQLVLRDGTGINKAPAAKPARDVRSISDVVRDGFACITISALEPQKSCGRLLRSRFFCRLFRRLPCCSGARHSSSVLLLVLTVAFALVAWFIFLAICTCCGSNIKTANFGCRGHRRSCPRAPRAALCV
jgi:hypothetical protein